MPLASFRPEPQAKGGSIPAPRFNQDGYCYIVRYAHSVGVLNYINPANRLTDAIILVQGQNTVQFGKVALLNLYIRLLYQQSSMKQGN